MRSINKVILVGNLTRDPEMRQTPNGQNVTTFGLATNRQWTTQNGESRNSAEFHECVAWAKLAEICSNYLKKGALVYVEGYLKTRSWDTPEGVKKFKTEIVVQDMVMLEKRNGSGGDDYAPSENENYDYDDSYDSADNDSESGNTDTASDADDTLNSEEPAAAASSDDNSENSPIDKDLGL